MITIHLIPNAHLDPVWLWDWREGLNEGIATCHAVAELMESEPDVTFVRNEAFIYRHIERYAPDLFERIRCLVESGRWEIAGGTMLQPDTNMGCGEGYVRQYLYGQAYFRDRFGIVPEVVYQVDSFGHSAGLPSIYSSFGCKYALQCRPSQGDMPTPSRLFRWRGPDGSDVLTVNLDGYIIEQNNFVAEFDLSIEKALQQMPEGLNDWIIMVGMGDHGGGLNRSMVQQIKSKISSVGNEYRLKFSTLREFFSRVDGRIEHPVVEGELGFCLRGCYTSAAPVKRAIRQAENIAATAERWASAAGILGKQEYPAGELREIWEDICFNHFHDILPGSLIERAADESLDHLGRTKHNARHVANNSALPVFMDIDTQAFEGVPVLLFNPHGREYRGPVEVEWMPEYRPLNYNLDARVVKAAVTVDSYGNMVPTQLLPQESSLPLEWRQRSCFIADVPAFGYAVYWMQLAEEALQVANPVTTESDGGNIRISNGLLCLEYIQGENGVMVRDIESGKDFFGGAAAQGIVLEDIPESWGGSRKSWDKIKGEFRVTGVNILETGPVKASILITSEFGASRLTEKFSLYAGDGMVRCEARLLWGEPLSMFKLVFPSRGGAEKGLFSMPYAITERAGNAGEVPSTGWGALGDFGIGNSGQYGFDIAEGSLRMSVVRSPYYGFMGKGDGLPDASRPVMDIGMHKFEFVIAPDNEIHEATSELNMPLHTTLGFRHAGKLPGRMSVLEVRPSSVQLSAVKQPEDGIGWILRLWNTAGVEQSADIDIMGKAAGRSNILAYQVQTLRAELVSGGWCIRQVNPSEL